MTARADYKVPCVLRPITGNLCVRNVGVGFRKIFHTIDAQAILSHATYQSQLVVSCVWRDGGCK